jgi:excisionase family DNA binding protein
MHLILGTASAHTRLNLPVRPFCTRRPRTSRAASQVHTQDSALLQSDPCHGDRQLNASRSGVDVVTIQKAMGHSALATTSRYLHARPASEQAHVFTLAFDPAPRSNARKAMTTDTTDAMPDPMNLSVAQAANLLNVSRRTILNWIETDKVPYVKQAGGDYRIPAVGERTSSVQVLNAVTSSQRNHLGKHSVVIDVV